MHNYGNLKLARKSPIYEEFYISVKVLEKYPFKT